MISMSRRFRRFGPSSFLRAIIASKSEVNSLLEKKQIFFFQFDLTHEIESCIVLTN